LGIYSQEPREQLFSSALFFCKCSKSYKNSQQQLLKKTWGRHVTMLYLQADINVSAKQKLWISYRCQYLNSSLETFNFFKCQKISQTHFESFFYSELKDVFDSQYNCVDEQ